MQSAILRFSVLGIVLLLAVPAARAQQVEPSGTINFVVGVPTGEFSDHVDNIGFGLNGYGGVRFAGSPLVLGIDAGFMIYGTETRREPFSTTIPDVTVRVETMNNIVPVHLMLRMQPPSGMVRPYLDGLFGFRYFFTQTSINGDNLPSGVGNIAVSTNFDDFTLSYGVGGGLDIAVSQRPQRTIAINLGLRYLFGEETSYLKEGSIRREDGQVIFDPERSRTDMIIPQVGVSVAF